MDERIHEQANSNEYQKLSMHLNNVSVWTLSSIHTHFINYGVGQDKAINGDCYSLFDD